MKRIFTDTPQDHLCNSYQAGENHIMSSFELWLEFELWVSEPTFDPYDDFSNMLISFVDGRKFALNVWTFNALEQAKVTQELESPELTGKYLLPPDLFVEKLDRQLLEQVVTDLIRSVQLREEWLVREESHVEAD
ncbi:MAG: hypothetical protein KJ069_15145 [Anaerolineae bacterium]|nr:hypothetical protein [Anaerolineae bacterium]